MTDNNIQWMEPIDIFKIYCGHWCMTREGQMNYNIVYKALNNERIDRAVIAKAKERM